MKSRNEPFGRTALFFDLSKNTIGLVVNTMSACRKFSIALDLLLSAHIASLYHYRVSIRFNRTTPAMSLTLAILLLLASFVSSINRWASGNMCAARSAGI